MNAIESIDAIVSPEGSLEVLSQREVEDLCDSSVGGLYEPFRRCCLAVLNSGRMLPGDRDKPGESLISPPFTLLHGFKE